MYSVTEIEFNRLVDESLETIPELFKSKLDNIVFIIEDYPGVDDMRRLKLNDRTSLLGLYSGVPYTHRTTWYGGTVPDRILLFKKNIEVLCRTEAELRSKIREVIIHEIAHYFGMGEKEIREAGY
jgi:predicted Zn-dependent protease with MMP-like domain